MRACRFFSSFIEKKLDPDVRPAIAQLAEHLTVDICRYQMVPGSIPGGRIAAQDMSLRVDLLASHELQAQHLIRVLEASLSFHVAHVVVQTPQDTVSEWLRRWTRNPLGSARKGSNPFGVDLLYLNQWICSISQPMGLLRHTQWIWCNVTISGAAMSMRHRRDSNPCGQSPMDF